jgi:hypothetical protein
MSRETLELALAELGVACDVETRETLAVIRLHPGTAPLAEDSLRLSVVQAARSNGFTHVAVELCEDMPPGEALHRG